MALRKIAKVSLTDLVDIVSKSGTPKATKVAAIKRRPSYEPAFDFYKQLREFISEIHQNGADKKSLVKRCAAIGNIQKKENYAVALRGYTKWWGNKTFSWFDPPREVYEHAGVEVVVNPELGLKWDGKAYIVKLHFKDEPLSKLRVDLITTLMETSLRDGCAGNEIMSVLDVRNGKLFEPAAAIKQTRAIVDAELAYIAALWPHV